MHLMPGVHNIINRRKRVSNTPVPCVECMLRSTRSQCHNTCLHIRKWSSNNRHSKHVTFHTQSIGTLHYFFSILLVYHYSDDRTQVRLTVSHDLLACLSLEGGSPHPPTTKETDRSSGDFDLDRESRGYRVKTKQREKVIKALKCLIVLKLYIIDQQGAVGYLVGGGGLGKVIEFSLKNQSVFSLMYSLSYR